MSKSAYLALVLVIVALGMLGLVSMAALAGPVNAPPLQPTTGPDATTMPTTMMGMMMGMMGGPYNRAATPIGLERAMQIAETYRAGLNNPDLGYDEVMEFSQNYYVPFAERSTGTHAFEILIDRYTGNTMPEPGPNMMWNTKYGMMAGGMMGPGGMMGSGGMMGPGGGMMPGAAPPQQTTPVTPSTVLAQDEASRIAQTFLDGFLPGSTVGPLDAYYGYYTLDVHRGTEVVGMLSVNASTGDVWYHTWHGPFVQERVLR